jgi:hypothetical protein
VQLKTLMEHVQNSKKIFEKQLQIVRQKIIYLSMMNSRYSTFKANLLSKEIKDDLAKCDNTINGLRNVSVLATQYSRNISNLLIEYRQITDDVIHFYEFNLALRYNNEMFQNMNNMIKETITQATQFVIKFDNDKLLTLLHNLNERITVFYKVVMQLYTLDKVLMYLESLKKRIADELKNAEKSLSSTDFTVVEKAFATGSSNISTMEQNLYNVSFSIAKNNAVVANTQLIDALIKIEAGDRTNVLIQKDMKILKDQISILSKGFNDVNIAFNNIQRYFGNVRDASIINKTTDLTNKIKYIALFYQNLESEYANYKLLQRADFLLKIRELSIKVID